MTLYILEEQGRELTEQSLEGLVKEFLQMTGETRVAVISGDAAETDIKAMEWPARFALKIVFICGGNPYLLGAEQEDKVRARVLVDNRCCREIIKDIMMEDGIITS